jgi:hypothetical protein
MADQRRAEEKEIREITSGTDKTRSCNLISKKRGLNCPLLTFDSILSNGRQHCNNRDTREKMV